MLYYIIAVLLVPSVYLNGSLLDFWMLDRESFELSLGKKRWVDTCLNQDVNCTTYTERTRCVLRPF